MTIITTPSPLPFPMTAKPFRVLWKRR